jgi:hypothetical protein
MKTIAVTFEKVPTMAGVINMPSTRCPYGYSAMVGSSMCQLCASFGKLENGTVECKHE